MWPDPVIEADPLANFPLSNKTIRHILEVDAFVLKAAPQPLDEDVIQIAAPAIHGYFDARIPQNTGECLTGELTALICVEYLWRTITLYGLLQSLNAKARIHAVRQTPAQHMARGPIHDRHQIQKAASHGDKSNIRAPDMVRPGDRQPSEQIGIYFVLRVRITGSGLAVYGFQPHQPHQATDPVATNGKTLPLQMTHQLPAAVKRIQHEQLIHTPHDEHISRRFAHSLIIKRTPADMQKLTLSGQAQDVMIMVNHVLAFLMAHPLSPFSKKSLTIVNSPILACRTLISPSMSR